MIRRASVSWMTLVLFGVAGASDAGADADESAAELYGRGVHAYFSGDDALAAELLSRSIAQLPTDPRAYYFRGLTRANLGGVDAGMSDFLQGADVEYNNPGRPIVDINGALQRVQGPLRLELEKVRAATLQVALERQRQRNRVRYEELKRREDVVLFDPQRSATPLGIDLPQPDLGGKPDPFASGLAFSGGKPVQVVTPTPADAIKPETAGQPRDPFAAPEPGAPSAPDDPFATPVTKPAASPVTPELPPAADAANPLGENLPKRELPREGKPPSPGSQTTGRVINLLGKAVSGQAADRDPFAPSKEQAAADTPPQKPSPQKPSNSPPPNPDNDPFR